MKAATYTAIEFCQVGSSALLKGVQHPDGVGPDVVTTPVQSFDPATGVIETKNTRYTKAAAPAAAHRRPASWRAASVKRVAIARALGWLRGDNSQPQAEAPAPAAPSKLYKPTHGGYPG